MEDAYGNPMDQFNQIDIINIKLNNIKGERNYAKNEEDIKIQIGMDLTKLVYIAVIVSFKKCLDMLLKEGKKEIKQFH